jgi:2-octaprenyl-6-methoxyphenol hydroxylase
LGQTQSPRQPLANDAYCRRGGEVAEPRLTRDFDASDISDRPFGWNLPNWLLRREMLARLDELPNVTFVRASAPKHYLHAKAKRLSA